MNHRDLTRSIKFLHILSQLAVQVKKAAAEKQAEHSLRGWLSAYVLLTSDFSYWMNKGYITNERKSIEAVSLLVKFRPPGHEDAITQNQSLHPGQKTLYFLRKMRTPHSVEVDRQLQSWEKIF